MTVGQHNATRLIDCRLHANFQQNRRVEHELCMQFFHNASVSHVGNDAIQFSQEREAYYIKIG